MKIFWGPYPWPVLPRVGQFARLLLEDIDYLRLLTNYLTRFHIRVIIHAV
jgi:hypothetical protein